MGRDLQEVARAKSLLLEVWMVGLGMKSRRPTPLVGYLA